MNIRFLLLTAAGFAIVFTAAAQSVIPGQFKIKESLIESIAAKDGESADYEAILNELDKLQKKPLDLNRVTAEDLQKLP